MILMFVQVFFAVVIGIYFWNLLRNQKTIRPQWTASRARKWRSCASCASISLTKPLAEKTRPPTINDIVGQKEGLRALKAALCSAESAACASYTVRPASARRRRPASSWRKRRKIPMSPFRPDAKFTEIDATTARFDERGIADPLIGSVHDPIYQGAGAMGVAGIPQPKPGAVTQSARRHAVHRRNRRTASDPDE